MKPTEIKVNRIYQITAGRNTMKAKVIDFDIRTGSWIVETPSGKNVFVKSPDRFLKEIVTEKPKAAKPEKTRKANPNRKKGGRPLGKLSGLDAAFEVLKNAGVAMNVKQILEAAIEQELCELKGATPHATISAAIQREIKRKENESRFKKVDKGLFAANVAE